MIISAINS